jgi:hypothetical protein
MLLTIAINVGNTENKLPSGKIIFNNNVIHSGEYNKNTFVLPQIVGTNELSISLDNKQDKDTIMKGNQIVEDVFVVVKDLKCEITNDSLNDFDTIGTYTTEKNENLKTFGYLSYNGTYKFVFDYPFFVFKKNKIFYQ